MSNKKVMQTIKVCDKCGKEKDVWYSCIRCGKDYCYDCSKKKLITYNHSVNFSGSGDGTFCKDCNITIINTPSDKYYQLLQSYIAIKTLGAKWKAFYEQFEKDSDDAEQCVQYHRQLLKVRD